MNYAGAEATPEYYETKIPPRQCSSAIYGLWLRSSSLRLGELLDTRRLMADHPPHQASYKPP